MPPGTRPNRRDFLVQTSSGALALCAGCAQIGRRAADLVIEEKSGSMRLSAAAYPALAKPGGRLLLEAGPGGERLVLFRRPGGDLAAVSATCTHWGCQIDYCAGDDQLVCPCHGSRFGADGRVVHGPASDPLPAFVVRIDGASIVLERRAAEG